MKKIKWKVDWSLPSAFYPLLKVLAVFLVQLSMPLVNTNYFETPELNHRLIFGATCCIVVKTHWSQHGVVPPEAQIGCFSKASNERQWITCRLPWNCVFPNACKMTMLYKRYFIYIIIIIYIITIIYHVNIYNLIIFDDNKKDDEPLVLEVACPWTSQIL